MTGPAPEASRQNVILLGASNLTISFPLVLRHLQRGLERPVQVFAAMGHGRSFGMWTRVLHRSLPGIVHCDLWEALRRDVGPGQRNFALITDIGNDLMYGAPVPQIADWIETCLRRLGEHRAEVAMTLLPMASIRRLGTVHYTCARTLLFPRCRICWPEMRQRVHDLHERIEGLARRYNARVIEPPGAWYGLDPIHIRSAHRPSAWREILSAWPGFNGTTAPGRLDLRTQYRVRVLRPALRRVFGRDQATPQPALRLDGLSVALY